MKETNKEIIEEALDEIESALKDPKGIIKHQRRLIFMVSLGAVALIESYLEEKDVLKSGGKINHRWLKKKGENAKKLIEKQIIKPINELKIDNFLDIAYKLEEKRNQLAYGKRASEEDLKEKIDLFLNLKKEVEKND